VISPNNIVVATDFSDAASAALLYGREFARTFSARLHVVHVVEDVGHSIAATMAGPPVDLGTLQKNIDDDARRALVEGITDDDMRSIDIRTVLLRGLDPARGVLEFAREIHADLLIVGTHGRGGLAHFFLGSVAQQLVRSAPCPVLTVRAVEREFVQPDALTTVASTTGGTHT
jgi:nucleotide-binding universal stress UspA family protein